MKVQPMTEQQAQEAGLLVAGDYDFEVKEATDTVSKAGNDMVALKLSVYDTEGRSHAILDWLVSTESMAYKIRHFAETVGLLDQYEKGDMPAEEMIGRVGKASIVITPPKDSYAAKNSVKDYVKPTVSPHSVPQPRKTAAEELDDSIPF